MIKWFKTLFKIVREWGAISSSFAKSILDNTNDIQVLNGNIEDNETQLYKALRTIEQAVQFIKDKTEVHVDTAVKPGSHSTVIIMGSYNGRDLVELYNICPEDLRGSYLYFKRSEKTR